MSDTKTRATATRDFKDAGTERSFTAGEPYDFSAGEFANFKAAGLVEPVTDATAPADAGEPAKTSRTRS
jgi:hypothetical protein